MKFCAANASILLILASFFTSTSRVFAQSNVKDTLTLSKVRVQEPFDFESVAKRLTGLSAPTIAIPPKDSLSRRLHNAVMQDLNNTHGQIDLSYAYGLNTVFIDPARSIGSIFNTSGDLATSVLGMPVQLSFNYSTLRVPLGTNNFFRLSLDKDKLMAQQKEKLTSSITHIEDRQAALQQKKAQLTELMGYTEVCLDALKRRAEREVKRRKDHLSTAVTHVSDSLQSVGNQKVDINNPVDYQMYYDSVKRVYDRITSLKNTYDSLSAKLEASRELLSAYQAQLNAPDLATNAMQKTGLLQSIKTLDIGLTYPKTTAMSGQNVPIKGLHVEIQRRNYYLSVASGLTLNNIMLSTNDVQNQLNYSQNVFNNFDFQKIMNNGWLTAIKTGYGKPEGTHAFIGFNYLTNTKFLNPAGTTGTQAAYDPAASFELDLRYVPSFLKGSAFDLVYGKTSLNKRMDTVTDRGVFQSVFSDYPSHLLLTKYTQTLSKIRTEFSVTYRRLDAFANTTTFGTMQPNNQRLEMKTDHRISRYMKLGLLYRMDATLRQLQDMNSLRLDVAGVNLSGGYTSYFNYSFFLNHVHHQMQLPLSHAVQRGNNYLLGLNLNSNYEIGGTKANAMLTYNDYLISDTTSLNKYTQFGMLQTFAESKYLFSVSYDYFFRRIAGIATGTSVFGLMGKYTLKKIKLGAGLKLSSNFAAATSLGGHLDLQWQVYKFLDVGMRAERFVLGDFYRNYYRAQYEQFPYLITFQTKFKI